MYATNKTDSSSDDWICYQVATHLLLIKLTRRQYSAIYVLHQLEFTAAVFLHHELPAAIFCRELVRKLASY
jgi:hypothetical protein